MSHMNDLVENFPQQLREAIKIGDAAKIHGDAGNIQNIIITGLGGSGIGGTILSEIVAGECPVPVSVNKDYFLPAYTGPNTLVVVCSYSGNTEETVQAMEIALEKKARVIAISSGGKIAEMAKQAGCDLILIPGGMPPRACLGYSLTQLFFVFGHLYLIAPSFRESILKSIELMEKEKNFIHEEAKRLTAFFYNKIPVLYACDGYNGVATRIRQQINENSKMLCWHHVLPEMNHNELVGWAENHPECAVLLLRNTSDYSRTQARMEISKEVFNKYTPHVTELWSKGETMLQRSLYLIHLTDWVSCYLADKKQVDASEINIINHLKGELAKI